MAGFSNSGHCDFCLVHFGHSLDCTFGRLCWECPNPELVALRSECDVDCYVAGAIVEMHTEPLWTRGLLPLALVLVPALGDDSDFKIVILDPEFQDGDGYVDGSGLDPTHERLRRCGWAAALMDDDGNPRRFQYGPLPGSVQTVPKAEMYALFMILSWVKFGATVWSDCKFVVDGFARGRDHPSNKLCLHSQLWRGIFDRARAKEIRVRKVLAHSTDEHVRLGLITPTQRKSNDFVDSCAKIGAAKHAADKHARIDQRKNCDNVRRVASFV